jgi:hypothetical protein
MGKLLFGSAMPFPTSAVASLGAAHGESVELLRAMGYVVVTPAGPKDGGDFGPYTPGTETSGLQEAFDYSRKQDRDLFISGGSSGEEGVTYTLKKTLHIPWHHSFRCDGGEYHIVYGEKSGDAVVIDSQMNTYIKLGSVSTEAPDGAAVHMKPETIGPDGLAVITASRFEFNYLIADGGPWWKELGKQEGKGIALFLDGAPGCITNNRFYAIETAFSDRGLYIRKDVWNNRIDVDFMHLCNTHIQIGDAEFPGAGFNHIETIVIDGDNLPQTTGARIFGHDNILLLNIAHGGIVFESTARNNIVETLHLGGSVTNLAEIPNNQVVSTHQVGLHVETPPVPRSGQETTNRNPWSVEVIILKPGQIAGWTITEFNKPPQWVCNPLRETAQPMSEEMASYMRPKAVPNSPRAYNQKHLISAADKTSVTIEGGLFPGQCIVLDPGDRITFQYSEAPSWRWKALR